MHAVKAGGRGYWTLVVGFVVVLLLAQSMMGFGIDLFKETWGEKTLDRTAYALVAVGGAAVLLAGAMLWRQTSVVERLLITLAIAGYAVGTLTARYPQERLHYLGYGLLAGLLYAGWALPREATPSSEDAAPLLRAAAPSSPKAATEKSPWMWPVLSALIVGSAIGLLDEVLQIAWPRRYFDWGDVLMNALSVAVGLVAAVPVTRALARRRT